MFALAGKSDWQNGQVYAFEALPGNVERWHKNMALNGMEARLSLYAGVVTRSAGPVRFLVHASGGWARRPGRLDELTSTNLKSACRNLAG